MADHPDTWARIIEMARARFLSDEPAAQAFARETYDAEETAAYAAAQDADDEEQAVLDAARRAGQLHVELCAELRDEATASASASAAAGRSSRAVPHVPHLLVSLALRGHELLHSLVAASRLERGHEGPLLVDGVRGMARTWTSRPG
jgi:hypothetical protein